MVPHKCLWSYPRAWLNLYRRDLLTWRFTKSCTVQGSLISKITNVRLSLRTRSVLTSPILRRARAHAYTAPSSLQPHPAEPHLLLRSSWDTHSTKTTLPWPPSSISLTGKVKWRKRRRLQKTSISTQQSQHHWDQNPKRKESTNNFRKKQRKKKETSAIRDFLTKKQRRLQSRNNEERLDDVARSFSTWSSGKRSKCDQICKT